ncbi:MAG: hypothetical protein RIC93_11535 [Alphaproteobacteria bacterium]
MSLHAERPAASSLLRFVEAIRQPSVGARCVRARKNRGTFQLVNRCPICRSVQIQHTRPDNRPPILRDYYMPPNAKIDLPFKGKGRTRVLNDATCEHNDKQAKSAEKTSQACVRMRPGPRGLVLVNVCSICKAGIVERLYQDGRREQETLAIAKRAFTQVSPNGATSARLVSETACR